MNAEPQPNRLKPGWRGDARRVVPVLIFIVLLRSLPLPGAAAVKVSEQDIVIPTYIAGKPEPNPMFYFGRGSQGAEGRVYPYPLYDTLTNIKSNKSYRIVYLENEYVRIGILPEIGGRLFEGVDKSNGYNFIYRQHVIKPALIGLIGAWISGGIEWNIPHHHRATTFLPVQYRISDNEDGSKTVWVGELELRDRMRWAVGYTLCPGSSCLECSVRIVNRTPVANTMLCFANVAVHVNENYQVIYPPGTRFVTFHSKHDFTTWPVATTRYAGADFTRGVDVSWYPNHVSANSMFAWNYEDDFFAGYDHGRQAGIMSVANHQIVPGKKFWTWGNGPRGRMWDKILTDNDGPYIELMVGAYSDNQPDYSWLEPYETKSFEMFWYPFRDIGGVKRANLDAAVNVEAGTNGIATVGFCTTAAHGSAKIWLKAGDRVLLEEPIAISPAKPVVRRVSLPASLDEHSLRASLTVENKELVAYSPVRLDPVAMPQPVTGPPAPAEMNSIEELYLAGQRIEQFHNPNLRPEDYWEEALRLDPADSRVNIALGIHKLKQARFGEAEEHFRKAIERLSFNYTSPKDGEAFYYLGVALMGRADIAATSPGTGTDAGADTGGKGSPPGASVLQYLCRAGSTLDQASEALYKATWSAAWRSPAYFSLAELAARRGDLRTALELVSHSLEGNALNLRALTFKAALLRHLGRSKDARLLLDFTARFTDPLDVRLMAERWLAGDKKVGSELESTLRRHPATSLETAAEYANAGLWRDGTALLTLTRESSEDTTTVSPLVCYYLGEFAERLGESAKATDFRHQAMRLPPDYVFPFQSEMLAVLRHAMEANPGDPRAPYYLGNLLFDWQPAEAVKLWERSAMLDSSFPIVHRNLAVAYSHQKPTNDLPRAIAQLELAVGSPIKYALHFAELDELYASVGAPPEKRLALLEKNHAVVAGRDDSLSREIGLKVFVGQYDDAIRLMTGRKFSVWEGGSLDVADHWVNAHLLRGRQRLAARQLAAALEDFSSARTIPENLPTERETGRGPELSYWAGLVYEAQGDKEKAMRYWRQAVEPAASEGRRQRRDGISDRQAQLYFQALARRNLGQSQEAETALRDLAQTAERALDHDGGAEDSAERLQNRQAALAHYLAGLAHLGLGETPRARTEFEKALQTAPDLLGPKVELAALPGNP
ncbi:MAG TPA: DUF5107 domain-containing protein [Candidatus Acidoferrum sp.]|nr:DUF5107 domain-containing protein [Candidatus Acidoferrum sp.]